MSWSLFSRAPADTSPAMSTVPMATLRGRRIRASRYRDAVEVRACGRSNNFCTRQLEGAGELSEQAAGPADDPEDLAVERDLEDPARERGLADEHHLIGAGRD